MQFFDYFKSQFQKVWGKGVIRGLVRVKGLFKNRKKFEDGEI
ncbi:MAG: hypothetical protein CM15mP97_3000 [Actinomycetota bacterium]|nr:MAG: hypothetical protein CM15mP97_3000 [Actinomycetota bacterium]